MDLTKAIELLEKAEHVAILLPPKSGIDHLASAEILVSFLSGRGKRVGFFSSPIASAAPHAHGFPMLALAHPLLREFVVSVATVHTPISQLRYEKRDEVVDIILSPKHLALREEQVHFRDGKYLCDAAILLGVEDGESVGDAVRASPEFFAETPLVNIDISPKNKRYGEANLIDEKRASVSEIVYELTAGMSETPLPPEQATLLLAGIIEATRDFTTSDLKADTLLTASELMRLDASLVEARKLIYAMLPRALAQLANRAAVRSKKETDTGVFWSFLTPEDFGKTGGTPAMIPDVLLRLSATFPGEEFIALVWQDALQVPVQVIFAGEHPMLSELALHGEIIRNGAMTTLATPFSSFREAEEKIHTTLLPKPLPPPRESHLLAAEPHHPELAPPQV